MIDTPQLTQSTAQPTAVIRLTVPASEIQQVMDPAIREVMATLSSQGIAFAGPCFTYHYHRPTDTFDFEVGFPVASPVKPTGRVQPGQLPAATVARTVYHGPYEGLAGAWGELMGWVTKQGHAPAGHLWEFYAVGPETSPDPAGWRTELNQPLAQG
jgi:effector-binding domain-containing protein